MCSSWQPDLQKPTSKDASTPELNPTTAAEVEKAALAREHAAFGVPGSRCGSLVGRRWRAHSTYQVPTGPATPSTEERALHEASGLVPYRSWSPWCIAARATDKPQ